eukprot:1159358-Pelagomonas_calceolata.AAC.2
MAIYKELLPTMGGYITYAGDLDRGRLEQLLARVGALELEVLEERAAEWCELKGRAAMSGVDDKNDCGCAVGLSNCWRVWVL